MNIKRQNKVISVIHNDMLYFIRLDRYGEKEAVESIALADLLSDKADANLIPLSIKGRVNTLLVVPDYWLGNSVYKFQSKKNSLAAAFIQRKLQAQFPQQPEIKDFFDNFFYQRAHEERWLYAYFLQDPQFFQLYKTLSKFNVMPHRITSPAFLWGSKIRQEVSDFNNGGKCFIELQHNIYNLYFFFEGNFLFSRGIPLSDLSIDTYDKFQAITYELNQSLYLFSQRAKAEVDQLYLLSFETGSIDGLAEALDREIHDLNYLLDGVRGTLSKYSISAPLDYLIDFQFILQRKFLTVSHRKLKKELEWRPVQFAGLAIGVLLIILLGMESLFLYNWSYQDQPPRIGGKGVFTGETSQRIWQYNEAIDFLIYNAERHSPREVIVKIAKSLPSEVHIQEIFLKNESDPSIDFKGTVKDLGADRLKKSLSVLIANLNKDLQPRKALTMSSLDFELDNNKKIYFIKFTVEL
jgi:hypothetical protein